MKRSQRDTEKGAFVSKYVLSCCSTVDLSGERLREREIPFIGFHYSIDGEERRDTLSQDAPGEFYDAMRGGAQTKTSMPSVGEFVEFFAPFLARGEDVLHVSLSGGLSGAVQAARQAAQILSETYPQRTIWVIDSLAASAGYGLLVETMAHLRDEGMDAQALYRWAEEHKQTVQHWFFSTDLSAYIRGGRISKTAGTFGGLLGICPLLHMDGAGRLVAVEKVRSKQRVYDAIVERMAQLAREGEDYCGRCFLSHSDCIDDARAVARRVEERFPHLDGAVEIFSVGTTIGSHTGPGTVALFFFGERRT